MTPRKLRCLHNIDPDSTDLVEPANEPSVLHFSHVFKLKLGDVLSDKRCHSDSSQYLFTMLFFILVYYFVQQLSIDTNPIPPINKQSLESNPCIDLTHCHTIWNIVWSCLITIFSCTWVAIHPNIPCPKKREAKNCFQRWIRNPLLSFAEHCLPLFTCR